MIAFVVDKLLLVLPGAEVGSVVGGAVAADEASV